MSRHRRQQIKRHNAHLSSLPADRLALAMQRFENTGRFPSYSTPAERLQATRLMRAGKTWFDLHLESK